MARVIMTGWKAGLQKIPLTRLLQEKAALSLQNAKECVDLLLEGKQVMIPLGDLVAARKFYGELSKLGVISHLQSEANYWRQVQGIQLPTLEQYAEKAGFSSFVPVFESINPDILGEPVWHSLFYWSSDAEARAVLDLLRQSIASSDNASAEVANLLKELHWCYQFIGAMAILMGNATTETIQELWRAFDSGSWVLPQLAVVAFYGDPDFAIQARRRIKTGCPIETEKLGDLDWITRHTVAGPISFEVQSRKAMASLLYLCRQSPNSADWLELEEALTHNDALKDSDNGESITHRWHQRIESGALLLSLKNGA
jgi:hypothetical protein